MLTTAEIADCAVFAVAGTFVSFPEERCLPGIDSRERCHIMIELTKMNGEHFTLNADLIEMIEEMPDTVITMTNGRKIIVKESRQNVKSLVKYYKSEIQSGILLESENQKENQQ